MHLSPQLLLMERKLQEVHPLLTLCGQIVENWQGNPIQKESLRVFFLVLQVTHYLDAGQVCTASHVMATGEQAGGGWASDREISSAIASCPSPLATLPWFPHPHPALPVGLSTSLSG